MSKNFKVETFSLAELFAKTQQPHHELALDMNAWNHPTGCNVFNARQDEYHTMIDYLPNLEETEAGMPKRIALLHGNPEHAEAQIFIRIPTGLYRPVGRNCGHPDGCFLRHDKKRDKRRQAQAEFNVLHDMFALDERAHLHFVK